jgi:glutamate-ammonia-ligase adenylyltransferase
MIAPEPTAAAPDPESARYFLGRLRQDFPSAYRRIVATTAALRCAVSLFSYSRFLSESVLRDPERLLHVAGSRSFDSVLTLENYRERLYSFLGTGVPSAVDFARFRRRQLLRILLRDVQGAATLANVTGELSNLADAILDVAYRRIRAELVARHGEPRLEDGALCGFSVISLGKLGGKELNYSSDIDLMFVYGGNGETDGPAVLTNKEFYKKVANQYTALLSTYTAEGQCYRVDLRLRPDGTLGEIAVSEDGARAYYSERARDWEKQMLIKARISAGESEPGATLLEFVEPLIYQSSLDFRAVEAVSETRQRISEKLAAKRGAHGGLDVKLTPGGIRDIEFLVQCLQRLHGGREQWVRHGGTVFALFRLRDKGFLSDGEYARLSAAYAFLRYLEHRLQMEEDRQTHTLPNDPERLDLLARKMPGDGAGVTLDGDGLKQRLQEHLSAVREIYHRVVHAYRQPARSAWPGPKRWRRLPRIAIWSACSGSVRRASRPRSPPPICAADGRASNIFWKRRYPRPNCWRAWKPRPPGCSTSSNTAPTSPTSSCATRNCWRKSASRSNSKADRSRTAPRYAVSTAARCCASSAKACWAGRPSSRRSARPACWPIASSQPPTASRWPKPRRRRAPAILLTIR